MTHARAAPFVVEEADLSAAMGARGAWADLAARCLEPNVFLDPDFALPAVQHLGAAARPRIIMVWAPDGAGSRDLVAVCLVGGGHNPLRGLSSLWMHDLSALGIPLLDRDRGGAALEALLLWAGRGLRGSPGLIFPSVPSSGATALALRAAASSMHLAVRELRAWERAALLRDGGADRAGAAALSAKGAKELQRQRRRLADRGALAYGSVRSDEALRGDVERFLALEAAGWKGAAGTALLLRPERAAFTRTVTRLLGRRGLCRIDSLTLDGEPIAMGILLSAGERDFFWKMAYREDLARLSPGVQFVADLAGAQARQGRAAVTDSCAVPDHPMIDRLWRDRIALTDLAIAIRPGEPLGFKLALAGERGARRLRGRLKAALLAWRRRAGPSRPARR